MKVFIIGSSHVKHLSNKVVENFGMPQHEIKINGISGGQVDDLYQLLPKIEEFNPEVIFLQIGSNDISHWNKPAFKVAYQIQIFLDHLSVPVKVVGMNFHRMRLWKRHVSAEVYNYKVECLNAILYKQSYETNRFIFWKHKGLKKSMYDILGDDGVHLNQLGNYKLYRSLRGCIRFVDKTIILS